MNSSTISTNDCPVGLVIFNLNDVLLETSIVLDSALRNAIRDFYPNITAEDYPYLRTSYIIPMGIKLEKLKKDIKMPFFILEKIDWAYEEYAREGIRYMELKETVVEFLNYLSSLGIKIAVITNTRKTLVRDIIKATKLNRHVDYIKCTRDKDINNIIPDPHIINYVCKHFKMPKANSVYVDNTSFGVFMGNHADIHTIEVGSVDDINKDTLLNTWRNSNVE